MANKGGQGLEFCGQLTIQGAEGYIISAEHMRPGLMCKTADLRCEGACRR
jgi:hypothetical protein